MNENNALETVAALIDSLGTWNGQGRMADSLRVSQDDLSAALKTLSQQPSHDMIAEVLVEKAVAAFEPNLRQFQKALCEDGADSVQAALLRLCDHFDAFAPHVRDWCCALGMPSVSLLFSVHIRCRLLQADLLSGREPKGKSLFIAFLRQHARDWLRRSDIRGDEENANAATWGSQGGVPATAATTSRSAQEEASTVQLFGQLASKSLVLHKRDAVFTALHRLTWSEVTELKHLWHVILEDAIVERVNEALEDEVYSEYKLTTLLQWEETAITRFVHMALPSAEVSPCTAPVPAALGASLGGFDAYARSEKESWCGEMRQKLLLYYARCRMAPLWDILAEYPDSIPALVDMRYCLEASQDPGLKNELIWTLKRLLAARLHRAGTRTEDILAMLIKTIHSLGVLLSRNDQNTVIFAVVGDTLTHLHKRKDSVAAIVQVITQWTGDAEAGYSEVPLAESGLPAVAAHTSTAGGARPAPSVAVSTAADGAVSGVDGDGDDIADTLRSGARGRPNILSVLLSAIPLKSLVQEYQCVLAQQLLSKGMNHFDTTPEEEVLERLKCTFGEDALSQCVVMIRDIHISRRLTQQLREMRTTSQPAGGGGPPPLTAPNDFSLDVLSLTAWPPLPRASASASPSSEAAIGSMMTAPSPDTFTPHAALQGEMDRVAAQYKQLRANQRLVWLLPESRVKIEAWQRDTIKGVTTVVPVEYEVNLFVASLVLFLRELAEPAEASASQAPPPVPLPTLARCVSVTVEQLMPQVQLWCPKLFVLGASHDTIALQTNVVRGETLAFDEAEEAATVKEEPPAFTPEQLKLYERLLKTMIKTQGPKTANEVFNSIKIVGGFKGTLADARKLLQQLVSLNALALNEAKLYTLP